jgi:hypothetical protein
MTRNKSRYQFHTVLSFYKVCLPRPEHLAKTQNTLIRWVRDVIHELERQTVVRASLVRWLKLSWLPVFRMKPWASRTIGRRAAWPRGEKDASSGKSWMPRLRDRFATAFMPQPFWALHAAAPTTRHLIENEKDQFRDLTSILTFSGRLWSVDECKIGDKT